MAKLDKNVRTCFFMKPMSTDQDMCIKKQVLARIKKSKSIPKKEVIDKLNVITNHTYDEENTLAYYNTNENLMVFNINKIGTPGLLQEAINHEASHFVANNNKMPDFKEKLDNGEIDQSYVDENHPGHDDFYKGVLKEIEEANLDEVK